MSHPLCFVLMPFGVKPDPTGNPVDFDAVYRDLIAPAIRDAQLEPLRADEEMSGGIIHKPMFERLLLCEFAVADLTTANANVFYELGIRHAVRPHTTALMFASGTRLPFDVAMLRCLPYSLSAAGAPASIEPARKALAERLIAAKTATQDSPLFQLIEGLQPVDVAHLKTDEFRQRAAYSSEAKTRLADARRQGLEAVRAMELSLGPISEQDSGVVIDLFLSYRAVKGWQDMVDLVGRMSEPLAATVMVREQLALALNRLGQGEKAEAILQDLLDKRGPSSETYGLLGRVYKDRWAAAKSTDPILAPGLLKKAISAYRSGFEADWRDFYPGINAATLMELRDPPDPQAKQIIPVVRYAVERRIAKGPGDYWDHATLLELAVLASDEERALNALSDALACIREKWEPETTANNLQLILDARKARKTAEPWLETIIGSLRQRAK